MTGTRMAAIQMASGPNVAANLDEAGKLIAAAAADGASLVVLPENFGLIGQSETAKLEHAEPDGSGPQQDYLAAAAARHGIWLIGGSVPIATAGGECVRQRLLVFGPDGGCAAKYDKIHLFDVELDNGETYRESSGIEPGDAVVTLDLPIGRLGLTICYDLRFPELYRQLLDRGAEIFVVPSAFTKATGRAHWEVLLRARSIENLAWTVAPAQGGYHVNGRETWGHTMIVDPWGTVVAERANGNGFVAAEFDRERMEATRRRFPATRHRRLHDSSGEAQ
jgi:nitrilase